MLVWWWRNIEGDMELDGKIYPRYPIWHPIDHIHFEVMHRTPDGTVDVGSTFHLVEALGANMRRAGSRLRDAGIWRPLQPRTRRTR